MNQNVGTLKRRSEESSDEYPSPEDTNNDYDKETNQLHPVDIKQSDASLSASELDSDDVELWLISVPRHDSVRATLPGSKLRFPAQQFRKSSRSSDKRVGVLRGSYVYRERGPPQNASMRAAFVVKDEAGEPRLKIAKPFSKAISVAFDTEMDEDEHVAPVKPYPQLPPGLKLKYFPIGSQKRRYPNGERAENAAPNAKRRAHIENDTTQS